MTNAALPLLLCLVLPQESGAPLDGPAWRNVDEVIVQAGDRVITNSDVLLEARRIQVRQRLAISTQGQADALMRRALETLVLRALEAQAGEDQRADPELQHRIDRWIADQRRKTGVVDYVEQLEEQGLSALEEREATSAEVYASDFRRQGLGGPRPTRDDFVRPGELREVHRVQGQRLLGQPPSYRVQDMVVTVEQVGGVEACRELALELQERVLEGEEFGPLHEEYGNTEKQTRGVTSLFSPGHRFPDPELRRFCEDAEVGDVSPVIAVADPRDPDRVAGYRFVRMYEKHAGAPAPRFDSPEAQETLRKTIEERRNEAWLGAARARLQGQAYLWSRFEEAREALGGVSDAPPAVEPRSGGSETDEDGE